MSAPTESLKMTHKLKSIEEVLRCKVGICDVLLDFIIKTGSQNTEILESMFQKFPQQQTLKQTHFARLTVANDVEIPCIGHLVCDKISMILLCLTTATLG